MRAFVLLHNARREFASSDTLKETRGADSAWFILGDASGKSGYFADVSLHRATI
jgi:hypothetical protein